MSGKRKIAVIGLGYVGLPLAVAFSKLGTVIGFDINKRRISELSDCIDKNNDLSSEQLKAADLFLTSNPHDLKKADFFVVSVPTPVDRAKRPDLAILENASQIVGQNLKKGDIVVYESTVYPGCTEEVCVPILEKYSNLKEGVGFHVGYSPERINPGDKEHTIEKIIKIVSASDPETLEIIGSEYGKIIKAGIFKASSIKVAEAAKVIENTQRDINIALMNEFSIIFNKMNINTLEVLEAAKTKWNFLNFVPGLVGGHCVGVDPYYLTYRAEQFDYHAEVILSGRRINDYMGKHIALETIRKITSCGLSPADTKITIMGLTFKANCPDLRNSKVFDIIQELRRYNFNQISFCDPVAGPDPILDEESIKLTSLNELPKSHVIIFAVDHKEFTELGLQDLRRLAYERPILIDVKGMFFKRKEIVNSEFSYWNL